MKNLNNSVIKVLNREHGTRVIEYFKSSGYNTHGFLGINTEESNSPNVYYGVKLNGRFGNFPIATVDTLNLHVIDLPEELTFPREMIVWNKFQEPKTRRLVLAQFCTAHRTGYVTVRINHENNFNTGQRFRTEEFTNAMEIPAIQEMKLEDVCKELGREIKIIK